MFVKIIESRIDFSICSISFKKTSCFVLPNEIDVGVCCHLEAVESFLESLLGVLTMGELSEGCLKRYGELWGKGKESRVRSYEKDG